MFWPCGQFVHTNNTFVWDNLLLCGRLVGIQNMALRTPVRSPHLAALVTVSKGQASLSDLASLLPAVFVLLVKRVVAETLGLVYS